MKFFDDKFLSGELSEDEFNDRIQRYNNQIQLILKEANYKIKLLMETISLHDAKILEIKSYDKKVEFQILIGDNQTGRATLFLTFHTSRDIKFLRLALPFEIISYELDCDNEYKLSFTSETFQEIEIFFQDISILLE